MVIFFIVLIYDFNLFIPMSLKQSPKYQSMGGHGLL